MPAVPIVLAVTGVSAGIGAGVATAIGLGTVSTAVATAIGTGVIAGGMTAAQGGDAGDVLKSAVVGGATSFVGGSIAAGVGEAVAETTGSAVTGKIVGNVAAAGLTSGGNEDAMLRAGLLGGIGAGINEARTAAVDEYLGSINPDPYGSSEAVDPNVAFGGTAEPVDLSQLPPQDFGMPVSMDTPFYAADNQGGLPQTSDDSADLAQAPEQSNLQTDNLQAEQALNAKLSALDTAKRLAPTALDAAMSSGLSGTPSVSGGLTSAGLTPSDGAGASNADAIPWLNTTAQVLKGQTPTTTPPTSETVKLADLQNIYDQIDPDLMRVLVERGAIPAAMGGSIHQFASGGSSCSTSSCSLWGSLSKYAPKTVSPSSSMISTGPSRRQQVTLAQLKQISPYGVFSGMAKGGLPSKYREAAPDGHNPEFITGLTGFYANGRGTGQSDDIPAMLHDGDYVMDADTVAALGDGSSKAGAQALESLRTKVPHRMAEGGKAVPAQSADGEYVFPEAFVTALGNGDNKRGAKMLDAMRENLRAHKRSAPTSKIPPKALSPLDYLNKSKG